MRQLTQEEIYESDKANRAFKEGFRKGRNWMLGLIFAVGAIAIYFIPIIFPITY